MKHSFAAIVTSFFSFHIAVNTLDGSAGFNRSMAREMQGERVPLLAREREAPRLRVRDDGVTKASRWSRVAMMASGAVALGVVATHARTGVFSGPAEASLGQPVKVEEVEPYADQYKGPVFIHIPKNGGTSIELLAAYNGVRCVARARRRERDHGVIRGISLGRPLGAYRRRLAAGVLAVLRAAPDPIARVARKGSLARSFVAPRDRPIASFRSRNARSGC